VLVLPAAIYVTETQHSNSGDYVPQMYLAIIGLACFLAVGLLLFVREFDRRWCKLSALTPQLKLFAGFFRHGRNKYMLPVTIGACCMAIGFGIRIVQVHNSDSMGVYIGQTLVS
jgi:hypothetical protein